MKLFKIQCHRKYGLFYPLLEFIRFFKSSRCNSLLQIVLLKNSKMHQGIE